MAKAVWFRRFFSRGSVCGFSACGVVLVAGMATGQTAGAPSVSASGASGGMAGMSGHMYMTTLQPMKPGDQAKADAVVSAAKAAMAPYQDYKKALADGYEIFLPDVPQPQYHFTRYDYGREAWSHFDATKPTSLLYTKTADGGYKLVGAMYTDKVSAPESELDERIPLSIARWHQHINFCKAPAGQKSEYFGPGAKFGLMGSITTKEACEAAGGEFRPHLFGGWCMCIRMRRMRRRFGLWMTMIWATTIWTMRSCPG